MTEDHRTFGDGKGLEIANAPGVPRYGDRYTVAYPLREWGLDRTACGRIITAAGLPLPPKSACFFCPAMKDIEILQLRATEPDLYRLAIEMEQMFRNGRHFRGDNLWMVKAKHKVTKEKLDLETTATSATEARATIRQQLKDTKSPYQWELNASAAVPGLGRTRRWTDVVAA